MLKTIRFLQSTTAIAMTVGGLATAMLSVRATPVTQLDRQPSSYPSVALTAKVETTSGTAEIALAEYLAVNDVKFYGAYSCSHCQKQKSLFGAVAASKLLYVECAPDGENSQRQLCKDKRIEMFPTWIVKGQYFPGTRDLKQLAEMTGYTGPTNFKYRK
jgi:hypothetical protein